MKLLLAAFLALLAFSMTTPAQAADGPYRHVVLFKFKDSATKEQIKAVEDAFKALPSKIDTIQSLEWGTNVSPEKHDQGYTHCFFVTFKDKSGVEAYLPHAAHKAFGELLHPILDKVLVIDYVAQK
jgi:hypothetical protein